MRYVWACVHRIVSDRSGQAIVLFAVVLPVLVAFAAMAVDVGVLRYQKEQMQSAAEAAVMAAVMQISNCGGTSDCSAMTTASLNALTANGYTNVTLNTQCGSTTGSGVVLTLNNGPCALGSTANDPNYGNANYVEAVVYQNEPTYFARLIGINSVKVAARAEATLGNSRYCMYFSTKDTSSSGSTAVLLNGASITASCGLMDDSGSSTALSANGATLTTTMTNVHGGERINGSTTTPPPTTNVPPVSDPLSYLQPPPAGSCTTQSSVVSTSTPVTLSPGTFCSGLTINGKTTVTFSPGIYYMEGSMIINGGDTVSGNGVMFYFSSGSLTMNGGSHADFVAQTTGDYAGILFYQNPSDSSGIILNGDSTSIYQGTVYAPGANLTINGGNVAAYTNVDTGSLTDNGGSFNLGADYSSLPGGDPIKGAPVLVE